MLRLNSALQRAIVLALDQFWSLELIIGVYVERTIERIVAPLLAQHTVPIGQLVLFDPKSGGRRFLLPPGVHRAHRSKHKLQQPEENAF